MEQQREIVKDREIIQCIEMLLPTVDTAMFHIRTQLDALKMEDANLLLRDATAAIQSVSAHLLRFPIGGNAALVCAIKRLREAISYMADACDQQELVRMRAVLADFLLPSYEKWKAEVLTALSGRDFRYLQN